MMYVQTGQVRSSSETIVIYIAISQPFNPCHVESPCVVESQLILSSLNLPLLSSSTIHAANCCRNSPLVVDEDNLKWIANETKCYY